MGNGIMKKMTDFIIDKFPASVVLLIFSSVIFLYSSTGVIKVAAEDNQRFFMYLLLIFIFIVFLVSLFLMHLHKKNKMPYSDFLRSKEELSACHDALEGYQNKSRASIEYIKEKLSNIRGSSRSDTLAEDIKDIEKKINELQNYIISLKSKEFKAPSSEKELEHFAAKAAQDFERMKNNKKL